MSNTEPVAVALDSVKRAVLVNEVLGLFKKACRGPQKGLQFEGVDLQNPKPENFTLVLVLQDILDTRRDLSLVQWAGGPMLVRTADVDSLPGDVRYINLATSYIIKGGTDESHDLVENPAIPTGAVTSGGSDK